MIGVAGAGAFGTALAIAMAARHEVTLYGRDIRALKETRENQTRLPGFALPPNVQITDRPADLAKADAVLLCVPMQQLSGFLAAHAEHLTCPIIACCKGIEIATGRDAVQIITAQGPGQRGALLTGPSFAQDIAAGLPTALTLACEDAALGVQLQDLLSTPNLRLYRTADVCGAALGGALKNVIAIACGVAVGAGLGVSARAAIMTRGFAEMQKFALARGAQAKTLAGLSGFGDLTLTCTSEQSRNYRFGLALGRASVFDPNETVEGAATARALASAKDMPITQMVAALVMGDMTVVEAIATLMARPLKEE